MKRLFDIFFSLLGLIILAPLLLVVSILIKLDSPGTVFFRQERVGKNFKPFSIYKFRSMTADAPKSGPAITVGGDMRVTRTGRFIRKYKLDELPQLINVLKGDVSVVGPRPEVPKFVDIFRSDYKEILTIKPGITDYASIQYRDEESVLARYNNPEEGYIKEVLPAKIRLAKQYIREKSISVDIAIILKTLYTIVR